MERYAVFDVDGTILDSMNLWTELDSHYLRSLGVEPPENLSSVLKTMSLKQCAEYFLREFRLPYTVPEIMEQINRLVEEEYFYNVPLKPGAAEYLDFLSREGVRMCIATASEYAHVEAALKRLQVLRHFEFILTCTQIGFGKDSPEIFMLAARRFGAEPERITVYEDALHALKTAKAAGFRTAAVFDEFSKEDWEAAEQISDMAIVDYRTAAKEKRQ